MRKTLFLLLFAALALAASRAGAETVYRRGAPGEPATLDPQKSSTVVEADVLYDLFEGLVTYDAEGRIVPGVAASWETSADGIVWTFALREALWSDGSPVTADDFVYAFRRLLAPATGAQYANLFYALKNGEAVNAGKAPPEALGVTAQGERTLRIELERPTPYMLGLLAHQTAAPVNRRNIERDGEAFIRPGRLVSNGAYTLAEFAPNDRIMLARNPNFHDAKSVAVDKEIVLPIEDRGAAVRRFAAGEIDSYSDAPADQIPYLRERFGAEFHLTPSLGVFYFSFDTRRAPFSDARIRNALSMTVDREFLADKIWGGAMLPAYGLVPPGIANYGPPVLPGFAALTAPRADYEAKRLLAEAGYGPQHPLDVEMRFNTSENNKATAVALTAMWKPLGVRTRLVNTDVKTHYFWLRSGAPYDLARAGWLADYSDPQNFLFLGKGDNAGLNYAHWADPVFDAQLARAERQTNLDERAKTLAAAEARLLDQQPFLPLLFYSSKNLVSARVHGWRENLLDRHLTRYLRLER